MISNSLNQHPGIGNVVLPGYGKANITVKNQAVVLTVHLPYLVW